MAWPLHVRCRRKMFTFAISSADEFLFLAAIYMVNKDEYNKTSLSV